MVTLHFTFFKTEISNLVMTYHLESRFDKSNDDFVLIFPYKLFDAANANLDLIKWTKDGNSVLVYTDLFEENILTLYPNLVEIPQFTNFRRQMRAYGFTWYQHRSDLFEFSHNHFKRDKPEQLKFVLTRRKQVKLDSLIARNIYLEDNMDELLNTPLRLRKSMKVRSKTPVNYAAMQKRPYKTRTKMLEVAKQLEAEESLNQTSVQTEENVPNEKNIQQATIKTPPMSKAMLKEKIFDLEVFHSCQSWMLQNDPMLARQFELDNLNSSLQHLRQLVDIPIYFYD